MLILSSSEDGSVARNAQEYAVSYSAHLLEEESYQVVDYGYE